MYLKKLISALLLAAMLSCVSSAAYAADDGTVTLYTTQTVRMYSQPNSMSYVVQEISAGTSVKSYQKYKNGFTDCSCGKYSGWIWTDFLSPARNVYNGGGQLSKLSGTYDTDMEIAQRCDIYTSQSVRSHPIGTYEAQSIVHVNNVKDGWAEIAYGNEKAYVPTCYIKEWNIPENYPANATTWYGNYDWSEVYNYEYYKTNNKDLADICGDDPNAYIEHFVNTGMREGRQGKADFDVTDYIADHPGLYKKYGMDYTVYYKDACGIPY